MLFKNKIYLQLSPKQQQRLLPFLLFLYFSYGSYILLDIVYLLDNFLALARFQVNQRTLGKNRGGCVQCTFSNLQIIGRIPIFTHFMLQLFRGEFSSFCILYLNRFQYLR